MSTENTRQTARFRRAFAAPWAYAVAAALSIAFALAFTTWDARVLAPAYANELANQASEFEPAPEHEPAPTPGEQAFASEPSPALGKQVTESESGEPQQLHQQNSQPDDAAVSPGESVASAQEPSTASAEELEAKRAESVMQAYESRAIPATTQPQDQGAGQTASRIPAADRPEALAVANQPEALAAGQSEKAALPPVVYVQPETHATKPPMPAHEGALTEHYPHESWCDNPYFAVAPYSFASKIMLDADAVPYANLMLADYTVTFDANGGTLAQGQSASVTVSHDGIVDQPIATRDGYELLGWFEPGTDWQVAPPYAFGNEPVVHDITLQAVWRTLGDFRIVYNPVIVKNGVTVVGDIEVASDGAYADFAQTIVQNTPRDIEASDGSEWEFACWTVVSDFVEEPEWMADFVLFEGDAFTVDSTLATDGVIHMRAVYTQVSGGSDGVAGEVDPGPESAPAPGAEPEAAVATSSPTTAAATRSASALPATGDSALPVAVAFIAASIIACVIALRMRQRVRPSVSSHR